MSSNTTEDQERVNSITKRVNKILESRLENDKETTFALKELSSFFHENNIQSRRNLRSKIEKRGLDINEDFLTAFRVVKTSLDKICSDIVDMNTAAHNMTSRLNFAKEQTHLLLEQTSKLQSENQKICMEEEIAGSFLKSFQISKAELTALREANMKEDFFTALERVQDIHKNCLTLMQCGHQTSALDIMDQMSLYQEAALERLYRWAQTQCKNIESPAISQLLTKAMSKLQERPVLFKYVTNEYRTQRRSILLRVFLDALTKGGPGGTPCPIEMHAHDPHRYISDMLAFLHQTIPTENENLLTLLKGCDKTDITEEVQDALNNITEGVCTPLRVRVEHIIASDLPIKVLYNVTNLLAFYHQTFVQEMGEGGGLVTGLKELYESSDEKLMEQIKGVVAREISETISLTPLRELTPSPGLDTLLAFLTDLLSTSTLMHPSNNTYPTKIVGCIIEPVLQAVNVRASSLSKIDKAVYLLNYLHKMQSTLALYDFIDYWLEKLQEHCDAHLETLESEQIKSSLNLLNLREIYLTLHKYGKAPHSPEHGLQSPPTDVVEAPLSTVNGMLPNQINTFVINLENFISMPENLMMPSLIHLMSGTHRSIIHQKSVEFLLALYKQLYQAVQDPANGYSNPSLLMPRSPDQLAEILLGSQPSVQEQPVQEQTIV